jgi:hypothetical protein
MTAGSIEGAAAGYSLQDAAAVLGVSVNTLRKRIKSGQVRAERTERPQGYVWLVYLDGLQPPDQSVVDPPTQEAPSRLQQPPAALAQAEAMAAYTRSLLEPLVALVENQEVIIRDQAETIGRQAAEIEALRAAQPKQDANPGPVAPEATTDAPVPLSARWRVLASWVPLLVMLALATVTLLLTLIVLALTP